MRGVNKVIIVGTLGSDPEVKPFNNGGSVTTISVATSEQWNDRQTGEKREQTEWHRISLYTNNYSKLGEIAAQYLRKGSQVYIEGKLQTRKYQDQSGQDRYVTEIRAENMQMLGGKPMGHGGDYAGNYAPQNNFNQQNYQQNSPNPYQNPNPNPMMNQNPQMGYQQPPAQHFQGGNQFNQNINANPQYQNQAMPNYPQTQTMDNQFMPQNTQQPPMSAPQQPQPMQPQVPTQSTQVAQQQPMSQSIPMNGTPKAGAVDDDIPF